MALVEAPTLTKHVEWDYPVQSLALLHLLLFVFEGGLKYISRCIPKLFIDRLVCALCLHASMPTMVGHPYSTF